MTPQPRRDVSGSARMSRALSTTRKCVAETEVKGADSDVDATRQAIMSVSSANYIEIVCVCVCVCV